MTKFDKVISGTIVEADIDDVKTLKEMVFTLEDLDIDRRISPKVVGANRKLAKEYQKHIDAAYGILADILNNAKK